MSQSYRIELSVAYASAAQTAKVEALLREHIESDNGSYNYERDDDVLGLQVNVWGETSVGGDGCDGYHQEVSDALSAAGIIHRLESKWLFLERDWDEVIGDLDFDDEGADDFDEETTS